MRIRWSQLAYRLPGTDNEVGLAKIYQSPQGESVRFSERKRHWGEAELGYLALVPVAQYIEEELDEWIDVDESAFLDRDSDLWNGYSSSPEKRTFGQLLQMLWGRCLAFTGVR